MPRVQPKTMVTGKWIDELVATTGQYVRLETSDGVIREGRLSGLRTRELTWNGAKVLIPTEVELNGDPNDTIPMDRIAHLGEVSPEE
jgi:hypothetical protein